MARPDLVDPVLADLSARVRVALADAGLPDADPDLERPKLAEHGDWATTVAMRLAKPVRSAPRDIATRLVDHLDVPDVVEDVSIAGPGFVNFRLAHRYHEDLVRRVIAEGPHYGHRDRPAGERETVNVEFVSANPTGPLHVGAGRWAATGDAIAALIEADGHAVVREYYVNDAGEQIRRFGESVVLVARGEDLTERHYRGAVIHELAAQLRAEHGDALFVDVPDDEVVLGGGDDDHGDDAHARVAAADVSADDRVDPRISAAVGVLAVEAMRERIQRVLHTMGVDYDVWFSERTLHTTGAIDATIRQLTHDGRSYASDGAVFLRTSAFGDDKDRVLVRSDGRPTYFAADCAYLREKASRADRLFYLLGADHHGYVGRLQAAAACLGLPPGQAEIRIGQMVNLLRGGQPVRMSKRAGETIDLDEVLHEVGVDVTRYHFLRQGLDTTIDFDLDVVAEQSMDNPVYYVQYAHARINSLVRTADERGFDHGNLDAADLARLVHPAELELLQAMARLPLVVAEAAELRATQRMARYAEDLAATFHRFYTECRVLVERSDSEHAKEVERSDSEHAKGVERGDSEHAKGVERDDELGRARYWLAVAARQVLANALGLLRVSAPERL